MQMAQGARAIVRTMFDNFADVRKAAREQAERIDTLETQVIVENVCTLGTRSAFMQRVEQQKDHMQQMEALQAKVQQMEALQAKVQQMDALQAQLQIMQAEQEEMRLLKASIVAMQIAVAKIPGLCLFNHLFLKSKTGI